MPRLTPQEAADKLVRNAKNAVQDVKAGIDKVTESPTAKAADNIDFMLRQLLEAFNDGRVEAGLRRVTLQEWKDAARAGADRIGTGLEKNKEKVLAFMREFFPHLDTVSAEVAAMPKESIEDSVARAAHAIRRNHEFGVNRRRG